MPVAIFQLSTGISGVFASEHVRLRCLLLDRLVGRPRSMMEVSDIFLLCDAMLCMGSRFSTRGDPRALDGEAALNGFDMAEIGVGNGFGERRVSIALSGVLPPEVMVAGVVSWVLLDLETSLRGAGEPLLKGVGEPLLDTDGDFGGTSGGVSVLSSMGVVVSTVKAGFTPGLRMGDKGFPRGVGASSILMVKLSMDSGR